MRELVIHPEAADETIDAAIYYRGYDHGISVRFLTEVYAAIERALATAGVSLLRE